MKEQVMVYEIKSSAVANAKELFSSDGKFFYWNDSSFRKLQEGDFVFVVNTTDKWVLFTKFINDRIPTEMDKKNLISKFSHRGEKFNPVAPTLQKLEYWENFIQLEVILKLNCPINWEWKSLGSSETTYLNGENVNKSKAENRIKNIEQLKELSENQLLQQVLNSSLESFYASSLNADILKIIGSDFFQKALREKEFHFQFAADKLEEFEEFKEFNRSELEDLLDDFSSSKDTYTNFILNFEEGSATRKIFRLIGQLVSYCDYNAADKNTLNEYEDKRVLAKSSVRQTDWVKWLLKYKINDYKLDDFPPNIKNALIYLKDPMEGLTILSENYREQVANNLLKVEYVPETFLDSLRGFFKPYDLAPQNPINLTWIISYILYQDAVKKLWNMSQSEKNPPKNTFEKNDVPFREIIEHAHRFIESKGFKYEYYDLANFFLSLKTKPFVILAGISGTGKTQLPRKFAEAIGMVKEEQVIQVPVRPDWTDASDLIGYTALDGNFVPKPLTYAILKAKSDEEKKPYFFILDEMNLARVEHYFSDFLSIIETREIKDGEIITDVILRDEVLKTDKDKQLYGNLRWPQNLFLIGTVNMDETTHAFSRKVLDRANSIEMNSIDLDWINHSSSAINSLKNVSSDFFNPEYIESKQLTKEDQNSIKDEMKILQDINKVLKKADLHFAYRVRDEVAFYLILNKKYSIMEADKALDFQLMQKVLPRIHGSSRRVYQVLLGLLETLTVKKFTNSEFEISDIYKEVGEISNTKQPKSVEKILFMLERFDEDRFTSFWV